MLLQFSTTGTRERSMEFKFLMEEVAESIRRQIADIIGQKYSQDILVSFTYYTVDGDDRSCFSLLNGMRTENYTANMMVAGGDERDCLCAYSPFRSRLYKNAKRGYAVFDTTKPFGRHMSKSTMRSPNCPGCKLTIRDMHASITINILKSNKEIASKKEEIAAFIKKIGKEAETTYGVHFKEARVIIDAKDYRV